MSGEVGSVISSGISGKFTVGNSGEVLIFKEQNLEQILNRWQSILSST